MTAYGDQGTAADYEEDHLIPLELGGNPTDPRNLWPQPYLPVPGAHEKDLAENAAHSAVCSGKMTLATAQQKIAADWIAFGEELGAIASSPAPTAAPTTAPTVPTSAAPPGANTCGAPSNPWGYNFCGGNVITSPQPGFCSYFMCIASFNPGVGYVVQCGDGSFSKSGGRTGACSQHGGPARNLLSP